MSGLKRQALRLWPNKVKLPPRGNRNSLHITSLFQLAQVPCICMQVLTSLGTRTVPSPLLPNQRASSCSAMAAARRGGWHCPILGPSVSNHPYWRGYSSHTATIEAFPLLSSFLTIIYSYSLQGYRCRPYEFHLFRLQ